MSKEEQALFEKLAADRKESAGTLEKTSMRGLKSSVVEKYSDQAHFIYELIQNADDVGATEARFELYKDRLVFIHNGTRLFSVSDLDTEEEDTKNGTLGDLNALTSIANSSKTSASIGKFGVGFKAVFQYTTTPYIYDPNISFKIERFIVPAIIEPGKVDKKKNETAFVFPFDHPDRKADEAYADISHKLQNLVFPTLFLKNLKKIKYSCDNVTGEYVKRVKDTREFGNTKAEKLELINGKSNDKDRMWLFTRETEEGYAYSCGFLFDKEEKLMSTDYYAFCFFPTKKDTNLNFIINAPFLLTDSREGIKATDKHNIRMISLLAELAADCFMYLRDIGLENDQMIIDDEILSYIPINQYLYIPKNERDDISLFPFYDKIKTIFSEEQLLPSFDCYVYAEDAHMAYWSLLSDLFSNDQLAELLNEEDAKWVLPSKGWETLYRARDGKSDYIGAVIQYAPLQDMKMIDMLTAEYIENQPIEWLYKLYDFILETDRRVNNSRTAPIFLNQDGKAVAAFDENDNAILFLDDEDSKGYDTVLPELMSNESTKKLIERLGVKQPELKDKITNKILKKATLNPKSDFRAFLDHYIQLIEADEDTYTFIDQIEDREFILAVTEDGTEQKVCAPKKLYLPTPDLKYYFEGSGDTLFVCMDEYEEYLKKKEMKYVYDFLALLGVKSYVRVKRFEYDYSLVSKTFGTKWHDSTRYRHWYDDRIDKDKYVLDRIKDNSDQKLSVILWQQLIHAFITPGASRNDQILGGIYEYFFRTGYFCRYEGFGVRYLKRCEWIQDEHGNFKAPKDLCIQDMARCYDTSSEGARKLIAFLKIKDEHPEYEKLDDKLRKKVEAYDRLASLGLFDLPQEKLNQLVSLMENMSEEDEDDKTTPQPQDPKPDTTEEKIINEIKDRVKNKKNNPEDEPKKDDKPENDSDEITKATVNCQDKIDQAKRKCEDEISRLVQMEEARQKAADSKEYSYGWFSALLELEAMASGEDNSKSREVSICFSQVKREAGTNRTLILSHPDRNIPQVMEELVDIPLDLTFSNGDTKRLIIEVANVQSYTLRVKIKPDDFIYSVDFSEVTQAKIVAQNPTFLTRELQKEFARFSKDPYNFDDDYDMQGNLCENIRFIFGPPGTGKTTYLARNVLIPMIKKEKKVRVLVLAPTNKAADVLVTRIMQESGDNHDYEDWLVRYGVTGNEEIEQSPVFHGKEFEIDDYDKCAVVTTMARFPYDYFIDSTGKFNFLHGINWDYIVVDEASMIPLIYMVYMLYLKTPKKFIIAGDPFQIEPTTVISDWKSQNIYTMVHLDAFSEDVETVPHKYEITLLTKQYRSIPSIGEVFSQLSYKGVLEHARENEDAKPLNIERFLDYENLNIIKFPVSQYESIYRSKQLKLSSYQVYSALFAYEFTTYMAQALARENGDEVFRIGIIAPYGAQAGIIDKLIASADIPDTIEVNCGTIHGFQGDECDIILALFNPPPKITTNKEMFLNRQNIVNVAISRARDYLFVLMPDDDTEGVQNLSLVNKLKRLIEKDFHAEHSSKSLEELLFDNEDYLEENAFSTGHQLVNVYGLPEKRYEIRSEDNAVDIQVHGAVYYAPIAQADEEDRPLTDQELAEEVLNKGVYHASYKNGTVVACDDKHITVSFSGSEHSFQFPKCFEEYLKADDPELQQKIEVCIENSDQ